MLPPSQQWANCELRIGKEKKKKKNSWNSIVQLKTNRFISSFYQRVSRQLLQGVIYNLLKIKQINHLEGHNQLNIDLFHGKGIIPCIFR
jgi:hypothetical protein